MISIFKKKLSFVSIHLNLTYQSSKLYLEATKFGEILIEDEQECYKEPSKVKIDELQVSLIFYGTFYSKVLSCDDVYFLFWSIIDKLQKRFQSLNVFIHVD